MHWTSLVNAARLRLWVASPTDGTVPDSSVDVNEDDGILPFEIELSV